MYVSVVEMVQETSILSKFLWQTRFSANENDHGCSELEGVDAFGRWFYWKCQWSILVLLHASWNWTISQNFRVLLSTRNDIYLSCHLHWTKTFGTTWTPHIFWETLLKPLLNSGSNHGRLTKIQPTLIFM